jgi:hypothetical protein
MVIMVNKCSECIKANIPCTIRKGQQKCTTCKQKQLRCEFNSGGRKKQGTLTAWKKKVANTLSNVTKSVTHGASRKKKEEKEKGVVEKKQEVKNEKKDKEVKQKISASASKRKSPASASTGVSVDEQKSLELHFYEINLKRQIATANSYDKVKATETKKLRPQFIELNEFKKKESEIRQSLTDRIKCLDELNPSTTPSKNRKMKPSLSDDAFADGASQQFRLASSYDLKNILRPTEEQDFIEYANTNLLGNAKDAEDLVRLLKDSLGPRAREGDIGCVLGQLLDWKHQYSHMLLPDLPEAGDPFEDEESTTAAASTRPTTTTTTTTASRTMTVADSTTTTVTAVAATSDVIEILSSEDDDDDNDDIINDDIIESEEEGEDLEEDLFEEDDEDDDDDDEDLNRTPPTRTSSRALAKITYKEVEEDDPD